MKHFWKIVRAVGRVIVGPGNPNRNEWTGPWGGAK